jgi:hypothetical protein
MEKKEFIDKPFKECEGGYYDNNNFYITPNGSFWDPDGVYFNNEGYDKHGGFYNENLEYQPGKGWIHELMCYEDENPNFNNDLDDVNDEEIFEEMYDNKNLDELFNNEDKKEKKKVFKENDKSNNNDVYKKEEIISPDLLFNKIPDVKIPKKDFNNNNNDNNKTNKVIVEKKIEVDSLFE